jgi:hypothetical protein
MLDADEGRACRLRFAHADGMTVEEQHLVHESMLAIELELPDGDADAAARFISSRSCSAQPASSSAWSMRVRALASGAFELPAGDISKFQSSSRPVAAGLADRTRSVNTRSTMSKHYYARRVVGTPRRAIYLRSAFAGELHLFLVRLPADATP